MFGAVMPFEREMMLKSQRKGFSKVKAGGKYKGHKPTVAYADEIKRLKFKSIGMTDISRNLNIGHASIHRILAN